MRVLTPEILLPPVWPPPLSLATTRGISVDVFSSSYLDGSVQTVPHVRLFDLPYVARRRVSPFGYLRISAHLQLPEAFRSLSRPSSAPDAKAFPLRSFLLDLVGANFISLAPAGPRSASRRELAHSVAPPLKSEPASLGFRFVFPFPSLSASSLSGQTFRVGPFFSS